MLVVLTISKTDGFFGDVVVAECVIVKLSDRKVLTGCLRVRKYKIDVGKAEHR